MPRPSKDPGDAADRARQVIATSCDIDEIRVAKAKGNDASDANYIPDLKTMVQEVLGGKGVRARAMAGLKVGQTNTLKVGGSKIRVYWLHPNYLEWVKGGVQTEAPVRICDA